MSNSKEQMQYLFDTAVKGVIDQGTKSCQSAKSLNEDDTTFCLYRGPNNLKCAVGHLISDSCYEPEFESVGIDCSEGLQDAVSKSVGFDLEDNAISLLTDLQHIHDNTALINFVKEFKHLASLSARECNLEWKF